MARGFRGGVLAAWMLSVCLAAPSAWAQKSKKPKADAKTDSASAEAQKTGAKAEKPPAGKAADAKADAKAPEDKKTAGVIKVETDQEQDGMKTYTFGPQDVEGRLKSPQIQYFLRRVRAEFEAGALGHRSFLRELSHTRHHHSVR